MHDAHAGASLVMTRCTSADDPGSYRVGAKRQKLRQERSLADYARGRQDIGVRPLMPASGLRGRDPTRALRREPLPEAGHCQIGAAGGKLTGFSLRSPGGPPRGFLHLDG